MMRSPFSQKRIGAAILAVAALAADRGSRADDVREASFPCRSHQTHAVDTYHQAVPPARFSPYGAIPLQPEPIHPRPAVVTNEPAPPPGSLGRTYQLRSWSIPADRHPRVAMRDLRIPGASDVRVFNDYEYRNEDEVDGFHDLDDSSMWHFETKELTPGVPHIYRVEATINGAKDVRDVRWIRGRRLEYDFCDPPAAQ